MASQDFKGLVRRYYEEVVSTGDLHRIADGRIVEHGGAANLLEPLLRIWAIRVVGLSDVQPLSP